MRKNNLTKSKKRNGAGEKANRTRKSTPLKNPSGATKTLANGFAGPKTSAKNLTWADSVKAFPAMEQQLKDAIQLYQSGRTEEATTALEKTNAQFPNHVPILWYLGGFYQDLGKPAAAVPYCRRATQLAPTSERASLGLFHALWENDQLDEALEEMKRFQLLTNWSCKDYVKILAEITEKWLDEASPPPKTSKRKKA